MKGIILAGGKATRLYPVTKAVCKQLLPIYDKPLIYYSISTLMLAGIKDILVISTPRDISKFKDLLGSGNELGVNFSYAVQAEPKGIAQSFLIGEKFIGKDKVCLILGDNIFYGHNLTETLKKAALSADKAVIFACYVKDPQRYGVIEFGNKHNIKSIEEKPKKPKSNWVVSGIYFYGHDVVRVVKGLKPSKRGELEITDVNNAYLNKKKLSVKLLGRGFAWIDTGTPDSLIDASMFIKTIEDRQGLKIGCIEEIAFRMGYISRSQLKRLAGETDASYASYLKEIVKDEK